ncbi:hypothetical protein BZA70DRAFT_12122 [Myxozyma melibiosi]|uniref:Methyltransferase type 11 domain-containing protein n=1 Tax=Myxozyma melibiosi TaxID=54550 RepID=A0ABR1FC21_9ASCO
MILRPQILRPRISRRLLPHPCRRQVNFAAALTDDSTEDSFDTFHTDEVFKEDSRPPSVEDRLVRRKVTNPLHERRRFGSCLFSLRLTPRTRVLEIDLEHWGTHPYPPMAFKRWLKEYPEYIRNTVHVTRKFLQPDPDGYIRELSQSVLNSPPEYYDIVCLSGVAHLFYPRLKTFLPTLRGLLKPHTGTLVITAYFDPVVDSLPKSYMRARTPHKKLTLIPKRRMPPESTPNWSVYFTLESLRATVSELVTMSETYNRLVDEFFRSAAAFDPNITSPSDNPDSFTPLPPSESLPPALRAQKENVMKCKRQVLEINEKLRALAREFRTAYGLPENTYTAESDLIGAMSRAVNSEAPYRLFLARNEPAAGRDLSCIKRGTFANKYWRRAAPQMAISMPARAHLLKRRNRQRRPLLRRESWREAFTENLWQSATDYKLPLQEQSGITRRQYTIDELAEMLRTSVELTDTKDEELERLIVDLAKPFKTRSHGRLNFCVGWYFGHIMRT